MVGGVTQWGGGALAAARREARCHRAERPRRPLFPQCDPFQVSSSTSKSENRCSKVTSDVTNVNSDAPEVHSDLRGVHPDASGVRSGLTPDKTDAGFTVTNVHLEVTAKYSIR